MPGYATAISGSTATNSGRCGRSVVRAGANLGVQGARPAIANDEGLPNQATYRITGVTRDPANGVVANCETWLFDMHFNRVQRTVSDGSGNYSFQVPSNGWYHMVVSYKVGAPDVAGVTKNTLLAVAQ